MCPLHVAIVFSEMQKKQNAITAPLKLHFLPTCPVTSPILILPQNVFVKKRESQIKVQCKVVILSFSYNIILPAWSA